VALAAARIVAGTVWPVKKPPVRLRIYTNDVRR